MSSLKSGNEHTWLSEAKTVLFAMIAEMDLVVKNLINIFFVSRFLGAEGAAAYEVVMPCIMLVSAFVALGYNGVQAVCAKDYGARDLAAFERHKNAGYTWLITVMTAFTFLLTLFKEPMLDLLGANDGSTALALLSSDCYSIFLFCFIPQSIFSLAVCFMYLEERRQLLTTNLILYGCILAGNIVVTVSGPSMTGYMLMNVIGISAADLYIILSCFIIRRKSSKTAFTAWNMRLADIRESFFTGLPDFMEYGFVGVLYLAENLYLLTRFSESVVAGVGVFEAIDNLPEVICVGFSFLVTAMLGTRVGKVCGASSDRDRAAEMKELDEIARRNTKGGVVGSLFVAAALLLLARPFSRTFLVARRCRRNAERDPAHGILRHRLCVLYAQFGAGLLLQGRGRVYSGAYLILCGGASVPAGLQAHVRRVVRCDRLLPGWRGRRDRGFSAESLHRLADDGALPSEDIGFPHG